MVVWIEGKSEERGGWGRGGGGKKERKENKNKKIIALIQVTQYLTKNSSREKPRFCAVIPEIHSPDPCGGQASCHFVLL